MTEKTLVAQAYARHNNKEILLKYFLTQEPLTTCSAKLPGIEIHAEHEGALMASSDIQLSMRTENITALIHSFAERHVFPEDLETEVIRWSFSAEAVCS